MELDLEFYLFDRHNYVAQFGQRVTLNSNDNSEMTNVSYEISRLKHNV